MPERTPGRARLQSGRVVREEGGADLPRLPPPICFDALTPGACDPNGRPRRRWCTLQLEPSRQRTPALATVAEATRIVLSGDRRADALMREFANWNYLTRPGEAAPNRIYYTFAPSADLAAAAPDGSPAAFNDEQRAAARAVLAHAAAVTGIVFVETADAAAADWHFASADIGGSSEAGATRTTWSYSYSGETLLTYSAEAFVFLDDAEFAPENAAPRAGNGAYETLLHEVGHALGLGHPFTGETKLPPDEDDTDHTVMSYVARGAPKSTFQPYDLLALQWIYGGDGLGGADGYNSSGGPTLQPAGVQLAGTDGDDALVGGAGRDTLAGLDGHDRLDGGAGDDRLDGGGGLDTAVYHGARADYRWTAEGGAWTVEHAGGADGADTLLGVERLRFADGGVALDLDGHAGSVAKLLGALFGPASLAEGDLVGIGLALLDAGMGYPELVGLAAGSPLFAARAGSHDNADFVEFVYTNVVGSAPPPEDRAYFVGLLEAGVHTQASLALLACETEANRQHIDLIGLASSGLPFDG
jgi:hypothetical protein